MQNFAAYYTSPTGLLKIEGSEKGICAVNFVESDEGDGKNMENGILQECTRQLDEYFQKKRALFQLPIDIQGTDFQKTVWGKLLQIPFGKTASYLDISLRLGSEKLTRAVGNANGKNKIAIIVPCHRVIGANGGLTGYAGGIWRKKWLLGFESGLEENGLFANAPQITFR